MTTEAGALATDEFAVTGDDVIDAQALANLINDTAALTGANYEASAENGVLTISNSAADIAAATVTVSSATRMVEAILPAEDNELADLAAQYNTVRRDFSTNMINTLTEGADKMTATDSNEEGAIC